MTSLPFLCTIATAALTSALASGEWGRSTYNRCNYDVLWGKPDTQRPALNKSDHPACHLFAVDKTGTESLIDITYTNVMVGPDPLLQITETQSEHNHENISTFARKMIDFLKSSRK